MQDASAEHWEAQIARLEAEGSGLPNPARDCALAEACRRAGRLGDAERTARRALAEDPAREDARAVLALVLLDAGRRDEAHELLAERALALLGAAGVEEEKPVDAAIPSDLREEEFEAAFAGAETDREQLIDPDRVAAEAAERVLPNRDLEAGLEEAVPAGSAFATRTMAELLESQGDARGASRIRAALDGGSGPEAPSEAAQPDPPSRREPPRRRRTIATLEHWLQNLRGMQA